MSHVVIDAPKSSCSSCKKECMCSILYKKLFQDFSKLFFAACPQIVTRKDWDGLRPVHVSYLPRPVALVIIQHTVTSTCNTDEKCAEIVRNIQSYHMENLNYWDIGPS
ncbi:unnamed protein product [Parnassius mnemosyne]|uniref:Peptidoglycan recognition protein family domain-containing protein n=1 Tax=Parnassius mnemosyne TaxID=213953 RepID=A0AAV1LU79_9NEOP